MLIAALTAIAPLLVRRMRCSRASSARSTRRCSATVKLTSALVFDFGVYLVVVGLVLMMFESFGDDPPPVDEESARAEPMRESVA